MGSTVTDYPSPVGHARWARLIPVAIIVYIISFDGQPRRRPVGGCRYLLVCMFAPSTRVGGSARGRPAQGPHVAVGDLTCGCGERP